MPKVLQVSTVAITLQHFIVPLANHFQGLGWQVDGAAHGIKSSEICSKNFDNTFQVPFSRNFLAPSNVTTGASEIGKIAREGKYDIVHVHTPIAAFMTRRVLRNRPVSQKLLYTAHGFHFYNGAPKWRNFIFEKLEKTAAPWMDHLVVMNQQDYQNALRLEFAAAEDITMTYGIGIDLSDFQVPENVSAVREDIRNELQIPHDAHVFLMAAGFSANKRHCDAVQALSQLPDSREFHLVLAGSVDGKMFEPTKELAKKLGVADRVHFTGFRTDITNLMVASDALVLISEREGLPRSIMEALSLGLTVIGSEIRGISDLVTEETGIFTPPCDPESLTRAMIKSVDFQPNAEASKALLEKCRMETVLKQYEEIYQGLLN